MSATAKAIFDGDASKLNAVILGIDRKLFALQAQFAAVASFAAAAFALPAAAAAGIAVGVGKVLEVGGQLNDLHNNTGIAVDDLVVLQEEFRQAGKAGEDVAGVIAKMQKALATGSADAEIQALGLDLETLRAQTPLQQFQQLGKAINGIPDPAARAAAAMALFGKSGATLLSLFASQGFGNAAVAVGAQAEILARDAALFDDAGDKLGTAGIKVQGFFVGVADRVIPPLTLLLDRLIALDLSEQGKDLGNVINVAVLSLVTGDIWAIMGRTIQYSLGECVNFFFRNMLAAVAEIAAVLLEKFGEAMGVLSHGIVSAIEITNPAMLLTGAGKRMHAGVDERVDNTFATADKLRGLGKYGNIVDTDAIYEKVGELVGDQISKLNALDMVGRALHGSAAGAGGGEPLGMLGGGSSGFSALRQIGGASGVEFGDGGDVMLDESRRQTELLRSINDRLAPDVGKPLREPSRYR